MVAAAIVLRWLAPQIMRTLSHAIRGFLPLCFVLFAGSILITASMLRKSPSDEIDGSCMALVSIILMTAMCAVGAAMFGVASRFAECLVTAAAKSDNRDDQSPSR